MWEPGAGATSQNNCTCNEGRIATARRNMFDYQDEDACMDKENSAPSPVKEDELSLYSNLGALPQPCTSCRRHDEYDLGSQDSGYVAHESFGRFTVQEGTSPMRSTVSFTSTSMDDDFFEDFSDLEPLEDNLPQDFAKLINGPRALQEKNNKPEDMSVDSPIRPVFRRALSLQNERTTPVSARARCLFGEARNIFKRPDPPSMETSPSSVKKHKIQEENRIDSDPAFSVRRLPLCRSISAISATDESIKYALQRSSTEPDLIGDFSKSFCLPLTPGRHQDLKAISSNTLVHLIEGQFESRVASFKVIDCRYPYEFEGGHIFGAVNIYTKEQCMELLQECNVPPQDPNKRHILVFHCEFSSERGPNLCRFLRKEDRQKNENAYPTLYYPEIYLLEGGYKNFYENFKQLCEPVSYLPMNHPGHEQELRKFRQKTKTWNMDARQRSCARSTQQRRLL